MPAIARSLALLLFATALSGPGCAVVASGRTPVATEPARLAAGGPGADYTDPRSWLCLPGREDACARDFDATELLPDGSRALVAGTEPPSRGADRVDCFYVYPTVDLRMDPANHALSGDLTAMARVAQSQAGRLRGTCRVFAPLYRQATFGAYLQKPAEREAYLAVAESDVTEAFRHYLATNNGGRKIVLFGHSQGADMIARILRRFFDGDAAMRERLLLALAIGGPLEVAKGQTTGGSFAHIPVCTRAGETACVIGYHSFVAGKDPGRGPEDRPEGREPVCVSPPDLEAGAPRRFSRTFFLLTDEVRMQLRGVDGIATPYVLLRDFYEGHCVAGAEGFRYLAVSAAPGPGDVRVSPVDLTNRWLHTPLGTHVLDVQLAEGDLVDMVARRAAALP